MLDYLKYKSTDLIQFNSIFFIGGYFAASQNAAPEILAASTLIWVINLALPSLFGMLFINRLKIIRKQKSEANGYWKGAYFIRRSHLWVVFAGDAFYYPRMVQA